MTEEYKTCYKCKEEKSISEFHRNRSQKDGYMSSCKACEKIRQSEKRQKFRSEEKKEKEVKKELPPMDLKNPKSLLDPKTQKLYSEYEKDLRTDQLIDLLGPLSKVANRQIFSEFDISIPDESIVVCFADLHIGSPHSDYDLMQDHLKLINKTKNAYIISFGDLIDNFNVKGPDGNQALISLNNQKLTAERMFTRYLDHPEEKILGLVQGNHEERSSVTDDFDFTEYLAFQLKVNYFGFQSLIHLHVGDYTQNWLVAHKLAGYSQWNNVHNAIKAQFNFGKKTRIDLVTSAHDHEGAYSKQNRSLYIKCKPYQYTSRWASSIGYANNSFEDLGSISVFFYRGRLQPYEWLEDCILFHGKQEVK